VALAEAFMSERPGVVVTFHRMDSGSVVEAVRAGVSDIGMAEFTGAVEERGSGIKVVEVARDGIGIIVNPANAVTNLTLDQVREVFGRKVGNWGEIGGVAGAIGLVLREEGSGTRRRFEEMLGVKSPREGVIIQDTSGSVLATVANDANSIGYVMHSAWDPRVRLANVDGVPCASETIERGAYALVTPTYLVSRQGLKSAAAELVQFVRSSQGKAILASSGLTPSP
jgi:phosphate transport system substrate-binding protein